MKRTLAVLSIVALAGAVVATAATGSALAAPTRPGAKARATAPAGNAYKVKGLVADEPGHAKATDPQLINAWGLAASPTSPWWVNAADGDVSTLYDGKGAIQPLVVDVAGGPTGLVFNGSTDFVVSQGTASGPSLFLFSTEGGTIDGWNPNVILPSPSTQSYVVADRSNVEANYKGLAIASTPDGNLLYATDFHNGRVDMFDGDFTLVSTSSTFVDPDLPDGFAPFGIQVIGDAVYVTYAKQDAAADDEVVGAGRGFVDAFGTDGTFIARVASRHQLNAPWGVAMAPDDFGAFSGDLLIGNFGDGTVHAYRARTNGTYRHVGMLRTRHGKPLFIDGLWALAFGNGEAAGKTNALYFTAGPDDEEHGLFGKITAAG